MTSVPLNFVALNHFSSSKGPVNALRAQNPAGGHFLGHEIRLVFVSPQYLSNLWYKLILLSFYCEKTYMV